MSRLPAKNKLLIDLGNSRLKWRLYNVPDSHGLVDSGRLDHNNSVKTLKEGLNNNWDDWSAPEQVWISAVASISIQQELELWLSNHWDREPIYANTKASEIGVINAYNKTEELGADRWLALIAARVRYPTQGICVVDCGSALTIDVIDSNGQHLGGQIVPGTSAMHHALQRNTRLQLVADSNLDGFFGATTDACINSGILNAQAALIERAMAKAEITLAKRPRLVLTGGGADWVKPHLALPCNHIPDLVFEGLMHRIRAIEEEQE